MVVAVVSAFEVNRLPSAMLKEVDVGNLLEVGFLVVLHLQEVAYACHQVWVILSSGSALEFVERQIEEIHSEGVG